MNDIEMYAAAVAASPFLLLTLLNTNLFGPGPRGVHRKHRRGELALDVTVLVALASSFFTSLYALGADDPPDLRWFVAYGLMIGGIGVFLHGLAQVLQLYRRGETGDAD